MGTSLLTNLDDIQWRHRRSLMNPAFHRSYLRNLMCHFNQSSDILLNKLRGEAEKGLDIRMVDAFSLVTLDVICKAGFGIDLDVINDAHSPFLQAYNLILKGVEEAFVNPFHKWDIRTYPRQRQVIKALQFLRNTGRDTIRRRCAAIQQGEDNPQVINPNVSFQFLTLGPCYSHRKICADYWIIQRLLKTVISTGSIHNKQWSCFFLWTV